MIERIDSYGNLIEMNILEYIEWLMDQGWSEEAAEIEASSAFGIYESEEE